MGVITELISVPVVEKGSHILELEKLVPENRWAFELVVPSASVVEKFDNLSVNDENLIEEISGEVSKIVQSAVVDEKVEDQIVGNEKLIEEKFEDLSVNDENLIEEVSGEVLKIVQSAVVDEKVEDQIVGNEKLTEEIEENNGVFEKVGLVVESTSVVNVDNFDYKNLIKEDPWNYDTIEVDEEELQRRHPLSNFVERKPRTRRYLVGEVIYIRGKDSYYYVDSSMIRQREESRKSKKHARGKDLCYYPGSSMIGKHEELSKSKKHVRFAEVDDAETSNRSEMIIKKEEPRKLKKRARDPSFSCWVDGAGPSNKKQKRKHVPKKNQQDNVVEGPPPELPDRFRDYIDKLNLAEPPLFVAQKPLYATDLDPHQSRLSFPRSLIKDEFFDNFLTEVEKQMLENKKKILVYVVDDNMHVYDTLAFTRWSMQKGKSIYVLTKDWNTFVADHRLKNGMVIQCWCFRVDSRLCFCLSVNRDP